MIHTNICGAFYGKLLQPNNVVASTDFNTQESVAHAKMKCNGLANLAGKNSIIFAQKISFLGIFLAMVLAKDAKCHRVSIIHN